MTLHAFTQYFLYKWKAKGRHGTHSPFVYAFIEDGIQEIKAGSLKELLLSYFIDKAVLFEDVNSAGSKFDTGGNNTLIAVKNIHATRQATNDWNTLSNDTRVRLSIDLYEYGLLFFDEAVKQKQHFVVKYPG